LFGLLLEVLVQLAIAGELKDEVHEPGIDEEPIEPADPRISMKIESQQDGLHAAPKDVGMSV
jgi:hypothetical protein